MNNSLLLLVLSLLGSIIALIGGFIFLFNDRLSDILRKNSIPFAAGVLITVSLLGLIPESIDMIGESALYVVLTSFFTVYLIEQFFFEIHHHDGDHHHENTKKSSVSFVILGDTIHNFIDGVAIGAAFMVNPGFGLITAFSTFLHEVPHEIGDFGILLKAGWSKLKILWINVFSSLATIFGAFLVYYFLHNIDFIGILLSISAGIFLYLGTIDFLPRASEGFRNRVKATIPLFIGIVSMIITLLLVPHSHDDGHEENDSESHDILFEDEHID